MKTKIYMHNDKDSMWDKGVELGLKGDALEKFKWALIEVELEVEVTEETGSVKIVTINAEKVWNKD